MWWHFITPLTTVQLGTTVGIYGETLVRIDGHTEKAGVCLEAPRECVATVWCKIFTPLSLWGVTYHTNKRPGFLNHSLGGYHREESKIWTFACNKQKHNGPVVYLQDIDGN